MKKIFTLIAMALVAIGASAQGKYVITGDIADGTVITDVEGITATFSDKWSVKEKDAVEYNGTSYAVCVGGATNPSPSPKDKCPETGCFIKFVPAVAGTVTVISNINANKAVWAWEGTTKIENLTVASGTVSNGYAPADAYAGPVSFDVKAGETYCFAVAGSKLMTYGFEFSTNEVIEKKAPTISIPETVATFINTEVSLSAATTGYPAPEVKWYKAASAVAEGGEEVATAGSYAVTPTAAGTLYYYAVATNSEGSATSNVCTITVTDPNIYLSEEDQIIFNTENLFAAGKLDGVTFHGGALHLKVTDTAKSKISVEKNTAYFGTSEAYGKIEARMKTGGKSGTANCLTLTADSEGTLYIYARSGNSSDARSLVLTQDDNEIFSQKIQDADAIEVTLTNSEGAEETKKVYPAYSCEIEAGEIAVTYPDNTMLIYGFSLDQNIADGIKTVNTAKAANNAIYNIAGQRVNANAKGIKIQNGKKFME